MLKVAIVGTVGVPGRYGGFETLADNLVRQMPEDLAITVYCSAREYLDRPPHYRGAQLRYVNFSANGVQSVPYDILSLVDACRRRHDVILLLGVSGAVALPLLRWISHARFVTNIDGLEWRRDKWTGAARWFLKLSERIAVRRSHRIIADNQAIAEHVRATYGYDADVIEYGGDHALTALDGPSKPANETDPNLPDRYALALCRIEPENNVTMILEAYAISGAPLVFIGNWDRSTYGRALRTAFSDKPNLILLDPIYQPDRLLEIRRRASVYVHGHSAGGTNPALVEMMHFDVPILAFDCAYNRHTTEEQALYFSDADGLAALSARPCDPRQAMALGEIARRRYTWTRIGAAYYRLLRDVVKDRPGAIAHHV